MGAERVRGPRGSRRTLAGLAGLALLAGCTTLPGFLRPASPTAGGMAKQPRTGDPSSTSMTRKKVADKRDPNVLVATDQSSCTVEPDRYAKIRIGDRVWCIWQAG